MPTLWAREILYAPEAAVYWSGQSVYSDAVLTATATAEQLECSRLHVVWGKPVPAGFTDDVALCTQAFVNPVGSTASSVLDSTQKGAVETAWNTFWTAYKVNVPDNWTLKEYRWYDYMRPTTKPGPATRITTRNVPATGTSTAVLPPQNAISVTFATASRAHWGRLYMPPTVQGNYTSTGRVHPTLVDLVAGGFHTLLNALSASSVHPVVQSIAHSAVLSIDELRVDDVPDIIRRRRPKSRSYRKDYVS